MPKEITKANVLAVLDRITDRLDATRLMVRTKISKPDHQMLVDLTLELQCVHDVLAAEAVKVEWLASDYSDCPTEVSDCASACECHNL